MGAPPVDSGTEGLSGGDGPPLKAIEKIDEAPGDAWRDPA